MSKTFKQIRKKKRNEKHAVKIHESVPYTNESIQDTLKKIEQANTSWEKQVEEKQRSAKKLIEDQKIIENKGKNSTELISKLPHRVFEQIDVISPSAKPSTDLANSIYRAKDGHHHKYRESSETEVVCIICRDIQLKKEIRGYELTPSLHKFKFKDNQNIQRYLAPSLPVTWTGDKTRKIALYFRLKDNHPEDKELQKLSFDEFEAKRMRLVILDECIASDALIEKLKNEGFDGEFLGRSLPDRQVGEITIEKNGILITEDGEFYESMRTGGLLPCFVRKDDSIDNRMLLIKKHMDEIFLRL